MTTNLLNTLERLKALRESYDIEYITARKNTRNIYKAVHALEEKYEENQSEETEEKLDEIYDIFEKVWEAEADAYDKYDKISSAILKLQDALDLLSELEL